MRGVPEILKIEIGGNHEKGRNKVFAKLKGNEIEKGRDFEWQRQLPMSFAHTVLK